MKRNILAYSRKIWMDKGIAATLFQSEETPENPTYSDIVGNSEGKLVDF
jgi:hypothetical protein